MPTRLCENSELAKFGVCALVRGDEVGFKKSARECLIEAIRTLVSQSPIERVTVADITELAGVSRTAFYKLFADKFDLAKQVFLDEISNVFFFAEGPVFDREIGILRRIDENRQFYQNAVKSGEFMDTWMKKAYDSDFEDLVLKLSGRGVPNDVIGTCAYLITQTLTGATLDWIKHRPECTPEEFARPLVIFCKKGIDGVLEDCGYPIGTLSEY